MVRSNQLRIGITQEGEENFCILATDHCGNVAVPSFVANQERGAEML